MGWEPHTQQYIYSNVLKSISQVDQLDCLVDSLMHSNMQIESHLVIKSHVHTNNKFETVRKESILCMVCTLLSSRHGHIPTR